MLRLMATQAWLEARLKGGEELPKPVGLLDKTKNLGPLYALATSHFTGVWHLLPSLSALYSRRVRRCFAYPPARIDIRQESTVRPKH
ncbi:hypothetical protein ACNKHM_10840 [Shigella sonnei]